MNVFVITVIAIYAGMLIAIQLLESRNKRKEAELDEYRQKSQELKRTLELCKHVIAINKGEVECEIDDPLVYEFFERHITELSDNEICHSLRWAIKNEHYRIAALLQKHF